MDDEYQWPGLSLSQSGGVVSINLKETALLDFEKYYTNTYCGSDALLTQQSNLGITGSFSAIISISVLDVDGSLLKQFSIPYIKGKNDYSVTYTTNKSQNLTVIANIQVTTGACGQYIRYYAAKYIGATTETTSNLPVSIDLVLKTSPTIGLSFGPWRYKRSNDVTGGYFVGGADTFFHTISEIPYNYYSVRGTNPKIIYNWPDTISYKIFVDYKKDSTNWVNVYNEITIFEDTFSNFAKVKSFEHNAVMELDSNDLVQWTGKMQENFYNSGKGEFLALEAFGLNKPRELFKELGTYRVYINKYDRDVAVATSNVFFIDVSDIITDVPDEPTEPTEPNPPEEPTDPVDPPIIPEEDEVPIPTTYKFNEVAYFKHTNGEAFTLNGLPYYGFFHILNGEAYVGRTHLESQTKLTRQDTLIADIFLRQYHFDTCFGNFSDISNDAQIDAFELLNLQGLNNLIDKINSNNIKCYRNLIIQNPTVYNFLDNNNHFYGLSTFEQETRYKWNTTDEKWNNFNFTFINSTKFEPIESGLPAKNNYSYIQSFSDNKNWEFLANVKIGSFVLDEYDGFKYFCSNGYDTYILEGNFSNTNPLKLISSEKQTEEIIDIYNDQENNKIFLVKNNGIEIYDSTAFLNCNNLILLDRLETNTTNVESIKFGKNIRSALSGSYIGFYNKYSNQKYYDFDLKQFGIKNILDISIRDIDDNIIILYKLNTGFYVCFFDPNNIQNTFFNKKIYELSDVNSKIEFSRIDSNIFHIHNQKEYQTRSLTFPEYPNGRLETENLLYHNFEYRWGSTKQAYNYVDVKWNSNNSDSNSYNNQLNSHMIKNNYMYMLLHNNGRIYSIKQPVNDRYITAAPLNLEKKFIETPCSQSSFGLYFNSMITNIVKDILNIYNKTSHTFKFEQSKVIYNKLKELTIATENLYINGNETINVLTLRRILSSIIDIQKKLLPNS